MKIYIELGNDDNSYTLFLTRYVNSFNWVDIKDSFIPFLQIILENYYIKGKIRFGKYNSSWLPAVTYNIEELLNIITIAINLEEK